MFVLHTLHHTLLHTLLLPLVLLVVPGPVSAGGPTEYGGVLSLFHDRVETGLCRARCLQTYSEESEGSQAGEDLDLDQCWTVCQLLSVDPPTWARVCQEGAGEVCRGGCLTACSHFTLLPSPSLGLQEDTSPGYRLTRSHTCSLSLPGGHPGTVFLVVGEDARGDWYEVSQTPHTSLDLVSFIVNLVIIKISHTGQLAVRQMAGCSGQQSDSWQLQLVSLTRDSGIFQVTLDWSSTTSSSSTEPVRGTRFAVKWSIGSVLGVLETHQTSASLSLPPQSRAVVQVSEVETGRTSHSLTVRTPPLTEDPGTARSLLTLGLAGATILALLLILGITIYLYRRTGSPPLSPALSLSASFTSQQEKSLISFDTFVRENRISVSDFNKHKHSNFVV